MDENVKAYAAELAKEQVKLKVKKEILKIMIASKSQLSYIIERSLSKDKNQPTADKGVDRPAREKR